MEKSLQFQMLAPLPHVDLPPPGGFTALLIDGDLYDDDVSLSSDLPDHKKPIFVPPPSETLESLIPHSLLSGYRNRRTPSFPHSSSSINPRKRELQPFPDQYCSDLLDAQQFQIPMLHSPREVPPQRVMPTQKIPRSGSEAAFSPPPTLESILNGFSLSQFVAALTAPKKNDEIGLAAADKGKKKGKDLTDRRRRITEKVRCLGKLLPGGKKMTTATILEEAHNYIQFLKAQIEALRSMPTRSAYGSSVGSAAPAPHAVGGRLGRLSRQELLEVVVNSPAAQAVLSSDKCCVVAAEQVAVLRNMVKQRLSAGEI